MVLVFGETFGMVRIGDALVAQLEHRWCLEVCRLKHCTCTSAH